MAALTRQTPPDPHRGKALLDIFRQGLVHVAHDHTARTLGQRETYLGLSELARFAECPRAAVAAKLSSLPAELPRLLTLQRGHWFERGVADSLSALGISLLNQLEIRCEQGEMPLVAHCDLVLVWQRPRPAVRILEIKSTEILPVSPHAAHERQILGQTAMLQQCWHLPVFCLRDADGHPVGDPVPFPQLCRMQLGVCLPDDVEQVDREGWLLCLSMRDAVSFGPYALPATDGKAVLRQLRQEAALFRQHVLSCRAGGSLDAVPHARGFHPLCSVCDHAADCPKFPTGDTQPQWEPLLVTPAELRTQRDSLETTIREAEAALRQAFRLSGTRDWIRAGTYRFREGRTAGPRRLQRERLYAELKMILHHAGLDDVDVEALLSRCEQEGKPGTRLFINRIS